MKFHKINSYTWVMPDGKKSIDEIKKLIDEKSLTKSDRFMEDKPKEDKQNPDYEKFCSKVFEERKFIPQIEFNRLIADHFNSNTTYYRSRMEAKGLIKVENKVVFKIEKKRETHETTDSTEKKIQCSLPAEAENRGRCDRKTKQNHSTIERSYDDRKRTGS